MLIHAIIIATFACLLILRRSRIFNIYQYIVMLVIFRHMKFVDIAIMAHIRIPCGFSCILDNIIYKTDVQNSSYMVDML